MILSNKWYNVMKWVVTIVMPASATLIAALGAIYDWSWAENAVATIVALATFLGTIMMISSTKYHKTEQSLVDAVDGVITVEEDPGGRMYSIEPTNDDLDQLGDKEYMTFRVQRSA